MKIIVTLATSVILGLGTANAASVTFINQSPNKNPMTVTYKLAYKNMGKPTHLGAEATATFINGAIVKLNFNHYQYAGVIPVSIDGHKLPNFELGQPKTCTSMLNQQHPGGAVLLSIKKLNNKHGKIRCKIKGGVTA